MFQRHFPVNNEIISLFAGFREFVKLVLRTCPPITHPKAGAVSNPSHKTNPV
jgi:hypothetical protein